MELFTYLTQNGSKLLEVFLALHGLALLIVNLTPTPKDNEALDGAAKFVAKGYKSIEFLAGMFTKRVKQ